MYLKQHLNSFNRNRKLNQNSSLGWHLILSFLLQAEKFEVDGEGRGEVKGSNIK